MVNQRRLQTELTHGESCPGWVTHCLQCLAHWSRTVAEILADNCLKEWHKKQIKECYPWNTNFFRSQAEREKQNTNKK